jgi:hypothetical protein
MICLETSVELLMARKGGTVQGHTTGKRGKKDTVVRKPRPFYYCY